CRSTKLSHKGVRYLELALKAMLPVWRDDSGALRPLAAIGHAVRDVKPNLRVMRDQLHLVFEGAEQQQGMLASAPHLMAPLGFVVPRYRRIDLPYLWAGFKLFYDRGAGRKSLLPRSQMRSREQTLADFPLVPDGVRGGVRYYDATFDDSRMALTFAMSAKAS